MKLLSLAQPSYHQTNQPPRIAQAGAHVLIAAACLLAALSPTVRSQSQAYEIAYRLHRGDRLFEGYGAGRE